MSVHEDALKAAITNHEYFVVKAALPAGDGMFQLPQNSDYLQQLQDERFDRSVMENEGILYRTNVVASLISQIKAAVIRRRGLLVGGPQGIGKSHSLVSLVETLRQEGHIVTFIPDCEKWNTTSDLSDAIVASLGTTADALSLDLGVNEADRKDNCVYFLKQIVDKLAAFNQVRKSASKSPVLWILVFDQLNRIFGRADHLCLKDMGVLPRPFKYMKELIVYDYVTCVVSASANNSLSYKENHRGFDFFPHPISMSAAELKLWKPELKDLEASEVEKIMQVTGGSPLQVTKYLENRQEYAKNSVDDVLVDVEKLLEETGNNQHTRESIINNAVKVLLRLPPDQADIKFDRKYCVRGNNGCLVETFPAVLVAYRIMFWKQLIQKVKEQEAVLLKVCSMNEVTNDVRGRLFELIVIARCQASTISRGADSGDGVGDDVLPMTVDTGLVFNGQDLPIPSSMNSNSLFIPVNSNFPAVDLLWKNGNTVWGVQVHIADHDDCLPKFRAMCADSGWDTTFDNLFLVYLSPDPQVTQRLSCLPARPVREKKPRLAKTKATIQVSAVSKNDVDCLKDLQWGAEWSLAV